MGHGLLNKNNNKPRGVLTPYLGIFGALALSYGLCVGWGAFVMPGNTFLPGAGPAGTALGVFLGAALLVIICINYHYMINRYPNAGGAVSFTKEMFGYDHGFIVAGFLVLTYLAILWANASALPLIFSNFFGNVFKFGYLYNIAGYEIYFGEALLSISAIVLFGLLVTFSKKGASLLQMVCAASLFIGIIVVFAMIFLGDGASDAADTAFSKPFAEGKSEILQVIGIMGLAPWAFVGFESVSHSSAEIKFSKKKMLLIMITALVMSAVSYIFLTFIASSAPSQDGADQVIPTVYAASKRIGKTGTVILCISAFSAIITGIIACSVAASRLISFVSADNLFPWRFSKINQKGVPTRAMRLVILVSLLIPFLGRTAIVWIVDITTITACVAYGYTSMVAFKKAKSEKNKKIMTTGIAGLLISVFFTLFLIVPDFWEDGSLEPESYLILAIWSVFGFVYYRRMFRKDKERRLGKNTIVWSAMLFIIAFSSLMWMRQTINAATQRAFDDIDRFYEQEMQKGEMVIDSEFADKVEELRDEKMSEIKYSVTLNGFVQMMIIIFSFMLVLGTYRILQKREYEMERQKIEAEKNTRAKSVFLSNMSHDIRTPMNAIIGYTNFAKNPKCSEEDRLKYLEKIDTFGHHLLDLINDILEMSRIESGKTELIPERTDITKAFEELHDLFNLQMEGKEIAYVTDCSSITNRTVMCDKAAINRVVLNLIGNAYKFTPKGGSITVSIVQNGKNGDGTKGRYVISVKDTGIGMSKEFAEKVFDEYSRDSNVKDIQGTGLGMSIAKGLIELMGGKIRVESEKGKGTEFIIDLDLEIIESTDAEETENALSGSVDLNGVNVLLVDDNEINLEIVQMVLESLGVSSETAQNGKEALDKLVSAPAGTYEAILTDIQMPVMGGYELARSIRSMDDKPDIKSLPIIALTANAFREDAEAAVEAGMNAHVAKPIEVDKMKEALSRVIAQSRSAKN